MSWCGFWWIFINISSGFLVVWWRQAMTWAFVNRSSMKTIKAPFEIHQEILFENGNFQHKSYEFHDEFCKQKYQINFIYSVDWIWKLIYKIISILCQSQCVIHLFPQGQFTWDWLPVVIFGSVSLLGGFLTLLLPETLHTALPDTLEQAEHINKKTLLPKTRTMSIRSMGPEEMIEESVQTETFI